MAIMADEEKRTLSDKFMLRLPDGMRDRIKLAADANNRSMNAEIVALLEEKFPPPDIGLMEAFALVMKGGKPVRTRYEGKPVVIRLMPKGVLSVEHDPPED